MQRILLEPDWRDSRMNPVTIPDLGIDWAGTMASVMTTAKPAIIAAIGVGLAVAIAYVAFRFLKRGVKG